MKEEKLKEFNYKFHNNVSKIDEYEKEPAYKRLGIEISHSRITQIREFLLEQIVTMTYSCVLITFA
jgi:thermostable 8-oxoguanine DNA glycosylase